MAENPRARLEAERHSDVLRSFRRRRARQTESGRGEQMREDRRRSLQRHQRPSKFRERIPMVRPSFPSRLGA